MKFRESHRLALTPLTPIHIGCGEDFEPTNYVIDEGVLFCFDPAAAVLEPNLRRRLLAAIGDGGEESIRSIQNFYFENRERFIGVSRRALAVAHGVERQYAARIGRVAQQERTGRAVVNRLEIERTIHHPHSGVPYIPGSSLKGSIRTGWLDRLNDGKSLRVNNGREESAGELEQRLLGGSFHTDPFRLIKIADAWAERPACKVVFAINHEKGNVEDKDGRVPAARGPTGRLEVILGGQYRIFESELRIEALPGQYDHRAVPALASRIRDFRALAASCNRFYLKRMSEELKILQARELASDEWLSSLQGLLSTLQPAFERGDAMLLRVGRHSGAESVTLDGVRCISIRKARGQRSERSSKATTLWLAGEEEDGRSNLLPFGWLLVEAVEAPEIPALIEWCAAQPKPDLDAIDTRLAAARQRVALEIERVQRIAEEQRRQEAEEAARREAEERRLESLSEQGRQVEFLRQQLKKHTGSKQPVSGVLYQKTQELIRAALGGGWSRADQIALADLLEELAVQKIDFGRKERDLKRSIRALRGEV